MKGEWDQGIFEAVREKNRLRREMSKKTGEERKQIAQYYTKVKNVVKRIINAKKKRKRDELNERLEKFRGKDEKQYWKYLKTLAGIQKKEEALPEVVQVGERVESGEKRKEVWNEAFSKLGKVDEKDENFDWKKGRKIKKDVESGREMTKRRRIMERWMGK